MQILIGSIKHFFPELSDVMFTQLGYFCELVYNKNKVLNLISRKDIHHIVEAHLLPSLAIFKKTYFETNARVLDIGTGAGFPGIPLAITMPLVHFTLIDSIGKKIKAVEEFVSALGLKNVTCINNRVENISQNFNHILGRAITNIDNFCSLAKPHLKPYGKIFYLSGGEIFSDKNITIVDLFELYDHQFCETKKLLII